MKAIKSGYHTYANIKIVACFLNTTKNAKGLRQLYKLLIDNKFCFRHTFDAGYLINEIAKWYKGLTDNGSTEGSNVFTIEETESIFEKCKAHLEIIEKYELFSKMEQDGMKHGYVGVRDARRTLYNLDYSGINLSYGERSSYYDRLKSDMSIVNSPWLKGRNNK